jgi:hypothetical protein
MPRPRRSVVIVCVAIVALAAFLPVSSLHLYAIFELHWVLLPDDAPAALVLTIAPFDEQSVPLLSSLPSRAPPSRRNTDLS